jgi:hypothetical protein
LITRAPALAAIGADHDGVASAVADAVMDAHWLHAPYSVFLLGRTRRAARLSERDGTNRRWWARTRDLMTAYDLTYHALNAVERGVRDGHARDRVLLAVLDRALAGCARPPGPAALTPAAPAVICDGPR